MKKLALLFLAFGVCSYENGSYPFCTLDNWGNENCYYSTAESCEMACERLTSCVECIYEDDN